MIPGACGTTAAPVVTRNTIPKPSWLLLRFRIVGGFAVVLAAFLSAGTPTKLLLVLDT